jgi:hypothetical protein
MSSQFKVCPLIDSLALEKGDKRKGVYHLEVTTIELMEPLGLKSSAAHHRYIKGLVEMNYKGTTAETIGRGDGSQGFKLHVRIWSK